jgi:hypothetical protein
MNSRIRDMKPRPFTPDELLKHSKPAGIDRVNLIPMSLHGIDKPASK